MNMTQAVRSVLQQYVGFSGRARRAEYWWWTLAVLLAMVVTNFLDVLFFAQNVTIQTGVGSVSAEHDGPLSAILSLAVFLPGLAVSVRRLHDVDKSGWWFLIILVPIFGFFYLLYLFIQQGTDGPNQFGTDPLTDFSDYSVETGVDEDPETPSPADKPGFQTTQERFRDKS